MWLPLRCAQELIKPGSIFPPYLGGVAGMVAALNNSASLDHAAEDSHSQGSHAMIYRNILGRCLVTLACLTGTWTQAATVVVTFEDLDTGLLSDGYGGVTGWTTDGVRENLWIPGGQGRLAYGGFNTAPDDGVGIDDDQSGLHFVNGPVVFDGTYFFNADAPAGVQTGILLYYQGQLVHRIDDPMTGELTWVASGYKGLVDTLYFAAGYDGFMIDNLTYSTPPAVPEPGGTLMLACGLTVMAGLRRLQRKTGMARPDHVAA